MGIEGRNEITESPTGLWKKGNKKGIRDRQTDRLGLNHSSTGSSSKISVNLLTLRRLTFPIFKAQRIPLTLLWSWKRSQRYLKVGTVPNV